MDDVTKKSGDESHAFGKMKPVLTNRKINLELKSRLLKCFVWSTLLYASESWTLNARTQKNLQAAKMWFYQRMLKIPWTAHTRNENVLQMTDQE